MLSNQVRRRNRRAVYHEDERDIMDAPPTKMQDTLKKIVLWSLWLLMIFLFFYFVLPMIQRGIIFTDSSEEKCKIVSFEEKDCSYGCDCKLTLDAGGDHHRICKRCYGKEYIYTVTAAEKCGPNTLLIQSKNEHECPETAHAVNEEIRCYVPHCYYETFTYHHHYKMIMEAIVISLLCLSVIWWIPYHFITYRRKSCLLLFKRNQE